MSDVIVFDSELLMSHYLICLRRLSDGKTRILWGHKPQDMEMLGALLANPNLQWTGFNSRKFDMPIALAAAGGASIEELKRMANDIVENNKPEWMTYRDYGIEQPYHLKQVDLIEVAPGVMVSLKLYGGRMGSPSLVDMPFHHNDFITDEQAENVLLPYCLNDIDETTRLYLKLKGQLDLREKLSERYSIDLRSKSDAQMAETIIAKELGLLRAGSPPVPATVRYSGPRFIQPKGMVLQDILTRVQRHTFIVSQRNGAVELPAFLADEPVLIGSGVFQMGVGGLHSKHDKSVHYVATPDFIIRDADVGAFYPNILLNAGYVPRGLGARFVEIYRGLVNERITAKHVAKKLKELGKSMALTPEQQQKLDECLVLDAGGKIMINGTFGKLGSCFSKIYSPDLMLGITLTGQFYLMALIEYLVEIGVKIISANTDGVTFGGTPAQVEEATKFIEIYGWLSNFEFEFVDYRVIAMKDCNNYIAVKTNGDVKAKGLYADSGLQKNPTNEVCSKAAAAYLRDGTPIRDFILNHFTIENFPDFLQVRSVKGGAAQYTETKLVDDWFESAPGQWVRPGWTKAPVKRKSRPHPIEVGIDPHFLGRVARWYYSTRPNLSLRYISNGNLVPKSEGGRACMKLPDTLPADVDIQRYISETENHLGNMGVIA